MVQAKSDNITVLPPRDRGPLPPYEPPKSRFGDDEYCLKWCAEWRAARAQQQKNWAEHELATMWGTLPDRNIELDCTPLERMQELEWHLGRVTPRTMLLARELLGICVTILAFRGEDPDLQHDFGGVSRWVAKLCR